MLLLLSLLASPALAGSNAPDADPTLAEDDRQTFTVELGASFAPPPALPGGAPAPFRPGEARLQSARQIRTVGVVCSIGGPVLAAAGFVLFLNGALEDDNRAGGGLGLMFLGGAVGLAGPPITMVGGYQARRVMVERGIAPGGEALEVLGWGTYALTLAAGTGFPFAVGFSWAFANTMIARAERSLFGDADPRFQVAALPTWNPQTRTAGLRVDMTF